MKKNIIQNTKDRIIESAKGLFSDNSYLSVSMNDIASRLKLTKASLYYHFTGKPELYKETLNQVYLDFINTLKPAIKEKDQNKKLYILIVKYIDFASREKSLIKAMYSKPEQNESLNNYVIGLKKRINRTIERLISGCYKNNKKIDSVFLSSLLIAMMDGIVFEYSLLNKKINAKEISKKISSILIS